MRKPAIRQLCLGVAVSAISAVILAGSAQAQGAEPSSADQASSASSASENDSDIVVTGTLLRGIAPTGTNVLSMSNESIAGTGAVNSNQILSKIPQVSSAFNQTPTLPTNDPGVSIIFPNIRNIPAASSATTLVLLDGHRLGGSGAFPAVDPDIIPSVVLDRVDVMPDGGSSLYGSDAVGGVINFITKRRFDGLEVQARYGFGDEYHTLDASVIAGKDWGSGSGYISYSYAETEELQGRDRSYFDHHSTNIGNCAPGTIEINRANVITTYALPNRTPGTMTTCNNVADFTIFPRLERHSIFGSITQELSDRIEANVTALYTRRESTSHTDYNEAGNAANGTITNTNPYYVPIAPDTGTQTVHFSFAGLFDNARLNRLEQYSITPSIKADLGGGWQVRALGTVGRSKMEFFSPSIDSSMIATALAGTTTATALNPYDLAQTNAAVLRSIFISSVATSIQTFEDARVIVDGSLLTLPGGEVKTAFGAEYTHEHLTSVYTGSFNGGASGGRNTKSLFAEVAVPIFGPDNATGGFHSLVLSASGRYDWYSTSGGTFNPKLGFNWQPIEQVTIRGNWGKSYNAAPLGDTLVAADTRAVLIPGNPFYDPTDLTTPRLQERPSVILAGGNPNLQPQKATTWSIGADVRPTAGLTLSATYYNIKMINQITIVPIFTPLQAYRSVYSQWVTRNPTLAQAQAIIGNLPLEIFSSIPAWYNSVPDPDHPGQFLAPAVILDARRQNLGVYKQDGIDFSVSYHTETSFGSINASWAGTYTLGRKVAAVAGDPFDDLLESPGASRFGFVASLGGKAGNFGATVNWSHSAGYDISPALGSQTHVDGFNTVDLYLTYDVNGGGLGKDLQFTAYVGNLFNAEPPFYNATPGYANGSTVGRVVQLGIRKLFQ